MKNDALAREGRLTPWQRSLFGHVMIAANRAGYFSVQTLYAQAEQHLQAMYPCNRSIRPNIRDELQNLRDKNLIALIEDGLWRLMPNAEMPCCSTECQRLKKCGPRRK